MFGVCSLISLAMSMFSSMPASWAMAGRCSMLFVLQPMAMSIVRALWKASAVMISRGRIFFRTSSMICMPACFARRMRSEYTAGMVPLPGRPMPSTSVRQFIELAVYMPEQEPHVGQVFSSYSSSSSSEILPAA